jgi:hypothetical protein
MALANRGSHLASSDLPWPAVGRTGRAVGCSLRWPVASLLSAECPTECETRCCNAIEDQEGLGQLRRSVEVFSCDESIDQVSLRQDDSA